MSRLEQLRKLAAMSPNDPLAQYGVGLECLNQEDWPAAIGAFDAALRADSKYSAAYYHKARAQINLGRDQDARQTLNDGLEAARLQGDWKTVGEMQELRSTLE